MIIIEKNMLKLKIIPNVSLKNVIKRNSPS